MRRSATPLLCPLHLLPLLQSAKHGVEIDYCPHCHGAWFERGELDKLIEAYAALRPAPPPLPREDYYAAEDGYHIPDRGRRRRSKEIVDFLEDLFDFD